MPSIFRSATHRREKTAPPVISAPVNGTFAHTVSLSGKDAAAAEQTLERISGEHGHLRTVTAPSASAKRASHNVGEFGTVDGIPNGTAQSSSNQTSAPPPRPVSHRDKATFLPTHIPARGDSPSSGSWVAVQHGVYERQQYGVMGGVGSDVTLSVEQVAALLRDVGKELISRGLETPLLFSSQNLETSHARVRALIEQYLGVVGDAGRPSIPKTYASFAEDLRLHDVRTLAWFLRWGLSRLQRSNESTGELERGMIDWETYEEWRGQERASNYPSSAYPHLASLVPSTTFTQLLTPLLSLLSRFSAHSHLSGLTPHALASYFAPLIFSVSLSSPALTAHVAFVRASMATEHLLLAYIRSTGHRDGLGIDDLPTRLKAWVTGYPGMIAGDAALARGEPRKGARVVRCERAGRLVRAYSKDLISGGETWAREAKEDVGAPGGQGWPVWTRVVLRDKHGRMKANAELTKAFKTKLAVRTADGQSTGQSATQSLTSRRGPQHGPNSSLDGKVDLRHDSLAGKEWSAFEEGGFDNLSGKRSSLGNSGSDDWGRKRTDREGSISGMLQFDLSERAKLSWAEKRRTLDWSDFASSGGGFTRADGSLAASLALSAPVKQSIESWPAESAELRKRLVKSQKESVPFAYNTTPRFGSAVDELHHADDDAKRRTDAQGRVFIEEAFIDFWIDLGLGAGWVDLHELTFRRANWAFVEFKARPLHPVEAEHPAIDPRTSEVYILFEERVPLEYQHAVANPQQKRSFASLFSPKPKKKQPADKGSVSGGSARNEFEQMLRRPTQTRKISASKDEGTAAIWHKAQSEYTPVSPNKVPGSPARRTSGHTPGSPGLSSSSFYNRVKGISDTSPGSEKAKEKKRSKSLRDLRKSKEKHQVGQALDFELHSASGVSSGGESPEGAAGTVLPKEKKDRWMDILVANGAKPMDRVDPASLPGRTVTFTTLGKPGVLKRSPSATPSPPSSKTTPRSIEHADQSRLYPLPAPKAASTSQPAVPSAPPQSMASGPTDRRAHGSSGETQPEDVLLTPRRPARDLPCGPDDADGHDSSRPGTEWTLRSYGSESPVPLASPSSEQARNVKADPLAQEKRREETGWQRRNGVPITLGSPLPGVPGERGEPASKLSKESKGDSLGPPPPLPRKSTTRNSHTESDPTYQPRSRPRLEQRDTVMSVVDRYASTDSYDDDVPPVPALPAAAASQAHARSTPAPPLPPLAETAHLGSYHPSPTETPLVPPHERGTGTEVAMPERISVLSASTASSALLDADENDTEQGDALGALRTPKELVFDVTPGREPSPARYKHGEALQFVKEDEEES